MKGECVVERCEQMTTQSKAVIQFDLMASNAVDECAVRVHKSKQQANNKTKRFLIRRCVSVREHAFVWCCDQISKEYKVSVRSSLRYFVAARRAERGRRRSEKCMTVNGDTEKRVRKITSGKIEEMATIACITWLWKCIYERKLSGGAGSGGRKADREKKKGSGTLRFGIGCKSLRPPSPFHTLYFCQTNETIQ